MSLQAALYNARKRRRYAAEFQRFSADISSPEDLGSVASGLDLSAYTVKGSVNLGISLDQNITVDSVQITTGRFGRTIVVPVTPADVVARIGYHPKGETFTIAAGLTGTVTLYVFDEWFRPTAIATGVFT